jgi:hypothetical protein
MYDCFGKKRFPEEIGFVPYESISYPSINDTNDWCANIHIPALSTGIERIFLL